MRILAWVGGVGLSLHLLACGQQEKMPMERTGSFQKQPAYIAELKEKDPSGRTEQVAFTQQEASMTQEAVGPESEGNGRPKVVSVSLDPPDRVYRGVDITAIPKGVDPDGDEIGFRYQWMINGEAPAMEDGPVLKGDQFRRGDSVTVYVTPFDQEGDGKMVRPRPIIIPNAPPKFTSTPPQEFKGFRYTYQVTAEDPDGDPVTFSLAGAPQGMRIDQATGQMDWEITRDHTGEHTIEVVAEDGLGVKSTQKYTLSITIP